MAKTRLGTNGVPGIPYGTLGPRTEIIPAKGGEITRLGLYGGPRGPWGTFDGKNFDPDAGRKHDTRKMMKSLGRFMR